MTRKPALTMTLERTAILIRKWGKSMYKTEMYRQASERKENAKYRKRSASVFLMGADYY
jgi:hypothetical protein